jgi:hypothetical protein
MKLYQAHFRQWGYYIVAGMAVTRDVKISSGLFFDLCFSPPFKGYPAHDIQNYGRARYIFDD